MHIGGAFRSFIFRFYILCAQNYYARTDAATVSRNSSGVAYKNGIYHADLACPSLPLQLLMDAQADESTWTNLLGSTAD